MNKAQEKKIRRSLHKQEVDLFGKNFKSNKDDMMATAKLMAEDYVDSYYQEFPDDLQDDLLEGTSTLNWGEFEWRGCIGNLICDLISYNTFEYFKLEKYEVELINLAWNVADDYLKSHKNLVH